MEEWMCGEEVLVISREEFVHFQKILNFSTTPHYETLTPEGFLVKDDYGINCFTYGPRVVNSQIEYLISCRSNK